MSKAKQLEPERHYFVDEAGDSVLFNKHGKVIVDTPGCSKHFILGTIHIENPHEARKKIEELRREILGDTYLRKIPSVRTKTSVAFHAKDDAPEIRMQVFKLFVSLPVKFYAIVRRKNHLVEIVRKQNFRDPAWRYSENQVYDACVKRLFKDRLHQAKENHITFATRGKSARTQALELALSKAVQNFEKSSGKKLETTVQVYSNIPSNDPCLQVVDYLLWALQRIYEKQEDRYLEFIQPKIRKIIDLEDKSQNDYGEYYTDRNKLTLEKIKDSLKG